MRECRLQITWRFGDASEATEKVLILSIPLISVPSGRFPRARLQPPRHCVPCGVFSSRCSRWSRRSPLQSTSSYYKKELFQWLRLPLVALALESTLLKVILRCMYRDYNVIPI